MCGDASRSVPSYVELTLPVSISPAVAFLLTIARSRLPISPFIKVMHRYQLGQIRSLEAWSQVSRN